MIYRYRVDGLWLTTGDLICTTSDWPRSAMMHLLRPLEWCMPGAVKHVIVYVGPDGRCVEAGPRGVIEFQVTGHTWAGERMRRQRGGLTGQLYGVTYPLRGTAYSPHEQMRIRAAVADYCLSQAAARKPYNWRFWDSEREDAFYCSQLAYKAYQPFEVNLNSEYGVPDLPLLRSVVFPQEVWSGCVHRRPPSVGRHAGLPYTV
jgi:hypothetical protein